MNISLTPELEKLVLDKVKSGMYLSSSEVIREALRLLEERDRFRELQRTQLTRLSEAGREHEDRVVLFPDPVIFDDESSTSQPRTTAAAPTESIRCPRTVPIGNDAPFVELGDKINRLLDRWGFVCRRHKGSLSWLVQPGTSLADRPLWKDFVNETLWKLCYYGPNEASFGVRRDLARRVTLEDRTLADLPWPLAFGVPPQSQVVFLGFRVRNDAASVEKVVRVINALG